jgi:hypothetical protein
LSNVPYVVPMCSSSPFIKFIQHALLDVS